MSPTYRLGMLFKEALKRSKRAGSLNSQKRPLTGNYEFLGRIRFYPLQPG
ncbi:Uncharacterised protein [Pseudomonas luteola]|uniref:Uncharacterized protein n=1 Tax=Pseudomonas luteola TaxID=47886 RepID=A0A2X2CKK9_PSELU|nr:Uncharacterised protein [Pseudomonas luteola]